MTTWERLKSIFPATAYQWIGPALLWVLAWCLAAWKTEAETATKEATRMVYHLIVDNPVAALLGVALVLSLVLHTMSSRLLAAMKPKDVVKFDISDVNFTDRDTSFFVVFKNNHPLSDVRCVCGKATIVDAAGTSISAKPEGENVQNVASGKNARVKLVAETDIRKMVGNITIGCDVYLNGDQEEAKQILRWRP